MAEVLVNYDCVHCPIKQDIFRVLSDVELEILNRNRHKVSYKAGETVFKQGTPLTHIACINTGLVKIYIEGMNNKNLLIKITGANSIVGGPGMYTDFLHHYTVSALEDTTICQVDVEAFEEVIERNSKFAIALMKMQNRQGSKNFKKFINLTQKHMPGRIADALLYLSEEVHQSDEFSTPISRQDLADMTAMTKESAIRILKEFKDADIIKLNGSTFNIMQKDVLRKISRTG